MRRSRTSGNGELLASRRSSSASSSSRVNARLMAPPIRFSRPGFLLLALVGPRIASGPDLSSGKNTLSPLSSVRQTPTLPLYLYLPFLPFTGVERASNNDSCWYEG